MQKFKNDVSDGWLISQLLKFFKNIITYWEKDITDSDFFSIFSNANLTNIQEAKSVIGKHFKASELIKNTSVVARFVNDDIDENEGVPSINKMDFPLHILDELITEVWNVNKSFQKRCRNMLLEWSDLIVKNNICECDIKDPMELRFKAACDFLNLDEIEKEVLLYSLVREFTCFDDFPSVNLKGSNILQMFYAMAIDCSSSDVGRALSSAGRLSRYGVLDSEGDFIPENSIRLFFADGDADMLAGRFFSNVNLTDTLPLDFYGKLAEEHSEFLINLIKASNNDKGLNILFYGAPGTGKTSFVKTLARELERSLYQINQGEQYPQKFRVSPENRMCGIRICNERIPKESSIMLIDEADQLLRTNASSFDSFESLIGGSKTEKGVINSILDEIRIPTIWISNTAASELDDSVRRRFDYSIKFEELNSVQRKAIWINNVKKHNLEGIITPSMCEVFSEKYLTNAGGISLVLDNVKRMNATAENVEGMIEKLMVPHCELMEISKKDEKILPAKDYSLEGLNIKGNIPLDRIVSAVKKFRAEKDFNIDSDRPRMNLLLWGPPGTGKTEFVKYLGSALNAKVSVKMGSDLLSCYVGKSEKNIKHAFQRAEEENAILFLDEIDGLVQDRSNAARSWEVTQVNELLHQMENFKGVMIAATNFMDNLDRAIMRRFTFKLQFDYLENAGKRLFFEKMFKTSLTEAELKRLSQINNLTPGDYRTVRQSLYYLGEDSLKNDIRLSELEKECSLKKCEKQHFIGF